MKEPKPMHTMAPENPTDGEVFTCHSCRLTFKWVTLAGTMYGKTIGDWFEIEYQPE